MATGEPKPQIFPCQRNTIAYQPGSALRWIDRQQWEEDPASTWNVLPSQLPPLPKTPPGDQRDRLSAAYLGWLPALTATHTTSMAKLNQAARQRPFEWLVGAQRPALPLSTCLVAELIRAHRPKTVFIESDPDGLALLVAEHAHVTIGAQHPQQRAWLKAQAKEQSLSDNVTWHHKVPPSQADIALLSASELRRIPTVLKLARETTRTGGYAYVILPPHLKDRLIDQATLQGFELGDAHEEIYYRIIAGEFALDQADDLVVLHRLQDANQMPLPSLPVPEVADTPHRAIEIHHLALSHLPREPLVHLADLLAVTAPRTEAYREAYDHGDHQYLAWFDATGCGGTFDLNQKQSNLRISLSPWDTELAEAAIATTLLLFGGHRTRVRPYTPTIAEAVDAPS